MRDPRNSLVEHVSDKIHLLLGGSDLLSRGWLWSSDSEHAHCIELKFVDGGVFDCVLKVEVRLVVNNCRRNVHCQARYRLKVDATRNWRVTPP